MTVTLVYADTSDGHLHSTDASYATSRNGPADAAHDDPSAYYGQNNNAGTYTTFQTFLRFAYPAVSAGEFVASAVVRTTQAVQMSPGVARDMELRAFTWSGSGLTTADWRTPAQLSALTTYATVRGVQSSAGRHTYAGSAALRAAVAGGTSVELVGVSSRQRAGNTPTSDEGSAIWTSGADGTAQDPVLIFTTVTRLAAPMGMEAQLSDGSWIVGVRPGNVSWDTKITLYREDSTGATTEIGQVPLGTEAAEWSDVPSAQGLCLTADSADNLYVVGVAGNATNSLRVRAYAKAPGVWTWSPSAIRTEALPAHDAPINNVAACWHPTAGGTLVVFAARGSGEGSSGGNANDLCWALLAGAPLLSGTGVALRATGSAQTSGLVPADVASGSFNGYVNETGSALDVVADRTQTAWGYLATLGRRAALGDNREVVAARYILTDTGAGFSHASYQEIGAYGQKDAGAKLRTLAVGAGQVAVVCADAEAGYGLSVQVLQASGDTPGFATLGYASLAAEGITSMPDGPAVGGSLAWDAVYNSADNAVWVYYVDTAGTTQIQRTSVSMSTYYATRTVVAVGAAMAGAVQSIRVPRNGNATQRGHITVGTSGGNYVRRVDEFNQPPLAPTLTARANYDATAAATFEWTFQDPNATDAQSAYRIQIERADTGVSVLDPGKTVSATTSRVVSGGTLANELPYRWRVRTWDALDEQGPWSPWGTFSTSAAGSVNITTPSVDNPPDVLTDDHLITWSVTGTVQSAYRVWVTRGDTGATVFDTGWTASAGTSVTITGMVSDVEHTVRVQVRNASAVESGIGTRLITPSYGTPETPLLVATPVPDGGYVLLSVENPAPQGDRPDVVRNRILRRRAGTSDPWVDLGTCDPGGSLRDYTAPGGIPLEYVARGES